MPIRTPAALIFLALSHHALAGTYNANPSNYKSLLGRLRPGDTLSLAPGTYLLLNVTGLRGTPTAWITITGPSGGAPARIVGAACCNTVEILNSSYVIIQNLTVDSRGIDGVAGISAKDGAGNLTHDILIENNMLIGQNAGQQTVGISTKTATWGWIIRNNTILGAGTGIYLGNSDGNFPFVAGIIENNLIKDTIGYNMQIKWQLRRPAIAGMPADQSFTIVRHNVFIKNDQPSPDGDRPNLLLSGFPDSGPGSTDMYEVYGNFFFHNSREALLQASGRVSIHDNIFVDGDTAIVLQDHERPLKVAYVYNNTVYTTDRGIYFGSAARIDHAVVANLVFAGTPISGSVSNVFHNLADTFANAALYVNTPSLTLGAMDFYPQAGKASGPALDLSKFIPAGPDYLIDFNGTSKAASSAATLFRGAYSGEGVNPGWRLQASIKKTSSREQ